MKRMKKLASFVLAMVMIMTMSMNVFAATVSNKTKHSYDVYQIFKGTQSETGVELGDIEWGASITEPNTFIKMLKEDQRFVKDGTSIFQLCETAKAVAEVLASDPSVGEAFANVADEYLGECETEPFGKIANNATEVKLEAGYYLFVDTEEFGEDAHNAKNAALLQVTNEGAIELRMKYALPKSDKYISKIEHLGVVTKFDNAVAVDAEIGDIIEFTLTGTVPDRYENYETYYYAFHDTLSPGMEFTGKDDVTIQVNGRDIKGYFEISTSTDTNGNTEILIECSDLKDCDDVRGGTTIVVTYRAKLGETAVIGEKGNPNKVYVEYSNNPNHNSDGDTGKTPEKEVLVFTYELDVNKVDGANNAELANAEFVLLNKDRTKVAKVVDGKLAGWADVPGADETGWPENTTLTSDADGKFIIKGLDSATYYLRETKAPAGYNLLTKDVELKIEGTIASTGENYGKLTALKITVDDKEAEGTVETGIVNATIENNKGSSLPETGGMGTTIFYLAGMVLTLGAAVIMVTGKRMSYEA